MNLLFFCIFALCLEISYQADHWTYEDEANWPGVCTTGRKQSPINIVSKEAITDKSGSHIRGPLQFRGYKKVRVSAENNGHTLKWSLAGNEPAPIVSGGPLRGNYSFMQFHLHWLSEHAIDGIKYPLEIHLVHKKNGMSVDQALQTPDGLMVIGILGQVQSSEDSEHALEQLMPDIPDLIHESDDPAIVKDIDVTRLLSSQLDSYYTYAGSLTTPECDEIVTWIVMDRPIIISDTQYKIISKVDIGGINNFRSLQATNNRLVYRSVASCSAIILPGLLNIFSAAAVLFVCAADLVSKTIKKVVCPIMNLKKKLVGIETKNCMVVS